MGLYKLTQNKRFNYSKNVKNIRRKEKKTKRNQKKLKLLTNEAKLLDGHWDAKLGMKDNMDQLGLSLDANKTIKIDKTRLLDVTGTPQPQRTKTKAITDLELAAKNIAHKDWDVSQDDIHFCIHMLDNHSTDWKAMARDRKNMYQLTPAQIRSKMKKFRMSTVSWSMYEKDRDERRLPRINLEL